MSSLYELTSDYEQVLNMLYDEDVDQQTILDTLEGIDGEIESKADNYARIINSLKSDVEAIKMETERLSARKKSLENKVTWLKGNLENVMKITKKTKFKTPYFSFGIQKNGGKRALTLDVDIKDLPKDYKIEQDPIPDNEKLREYLNEIGADACEYAHLEPQTESLRIR